MVYILLIITIVIIINLSGDNKYYKKENESLRKKINELQQNANRSIEQEKVVKEEIFEEQNIKANNVLENEDTIISHVETKSINNEKKIKNSVQNKEGVKNKFILMTGAVLIVLAAIVFLTSTWHTIPNIVKTLVILLLAGEFLGASKIAKSIFKLEESANTFLYIALAYLPISLFSISIFGLLGNYLSISGNGKNLYLTICSFGLAILYYWIGKRKKQIILFNASMMMQFLSVVFITQHIDNSLEITMLGIIIYNIVLTIIKKNYFKDNINIVNYYNYTYLYGSFIIGIICLFKEATIISAIVNAFLILNLCISYKEDKSYLNIILTLTQILIFSLSILSLTKGFLNVNTRELLFYIILIGMFAIGMLMTNNKWKEMSIYVSIIAMGLLYFSTYILDNDNLIIKDYIVLLTISILTVISYIILENRRNIFIHIIPISVFLTQADIIIANNLNFIYIAYLSAILYVFSILNLLKNDKFNKILQIYANSILALSIMMNLIEDYDTCIGSVFLFMILIIAYCLGYIKNRKIEAYKISTYVILNILIYSILYKLNLLQCAKYIVAITTIAITFFEEFLTEIKTEISKIYLNISYIVAFILLNVEITGITFVTIILLSFVFYRYINKNQLNSYFKIVPFIAIIPTVYFSDWAIIGNNNLMIISSYMLIVLTSLLSIKKDKINEYTIISGLYILLSLKFKLNVYINILTALMWTIFHFIKMENEKIKFEIIICGLGLIFYNQIIEDLSNLYNVLDTITALKYLGYIVVAILLSRNIIKQYVKNEYKIIEYIFFSILYSSAIFNYNSETDGMIFVLLLVTITIISYMKKYGPIFFTSIIAILVNVFLLTREFWFSVPWWIYMLTIGSILIVFAIRNELNENKQKELVKKKVKEFKEYMDM